MVRLLLDLLWDVDDPPDRIGFIGFCILVTFALFCAVVWFHHPGPHR
jgi:hypothetical protein